MESTATGTEVPIAGQPNITQILDDDQDVDSRSSSSNSPTRAEYEESDFFMNNNDSVSSIGGATPAETQAVVPREPASAKCLPAEILINIFQKLGDSRDLLNCMLTSKEWSRNAVNILWWRPACSSWTKHRRICTTLGEQHPFYAYADFVKRLNLTALASEINNGSLRPLNVCTQVERLTLTNCVQMDDSGLAGLLASNTRLLALDISGARAITETSINILAQRCPHLQGLNVTDCRLISNEGFLNVARNCKKIKRLKLNGCDLVTDEVVMAFALNCPNILEIDLAGCKLVGNEPITAIMTHGRSLRELRLANVENITDEAFLRLPTDRTYEHLRILDFTSCHKLTDKAVEKIIQVAPRLRNLVLAKCKNITDSAVNAICALGKNLHYLHLGHCGLITDTSVKNIVRHCGRIRYIDLGCCTRLTDDSVMLLAQLPKLRRIGLVKCNLITDDSVYALAHATARVPDPSGGPGVILPRVFGREISSLERVHLSYCTRLTLKSIECLLNQCPRLTHLSLTGVDAFLRQDLAVYCRPAPEEFNNHQRQVFCVFSGDGVTRLRKYLNDQRSRVDGRIALEGDSDDDEVMRGADDEDDDDATMTGMMAGAAIDGGMEVEEEGEGEAEADGEAEAEETEDYVLLNNSATPTNANP